MCIQPELKLFSGSRLAGKISSSYVSERSSFLSKIYPTFQSSTISFFFRSGMLNSNLKVVNIPSLLKLIQLPVGLVAPSFTSSRSISYMGPDYKYFHFCFCFHL